MLVLPQEYTIQKFYELAGAPKHNTITNVYNAGCPICHEGKSWGRKKRAFYIPKSDIITCHNCGWYGSPARWIKEVSGCSYDDIKREAKNYDLLPEIITNEKKETATFVTQTLPDDCINLLDPIQAEYWKDNPDVQKAQRYIRERGWDKAVNCPETLWFTFKDEYMSGRIIIPFYDFDNQIVWYQGRSIDSSEHVRWKSKFNSVSTCFNIHKLNPEGERVFIFEGPADAMFCEDGIAVAGVQEKSRSLCFSVKQRQQLARYPFHKRIWVLDSQWIDKAAYKKSKILVDMDEDVFIWPEKLGKQYKDFNEVVNALEINKIPGEFLMRYVHRGAKAQLKLAEISRTSSTYGALSGHDAQNRHRSQQHRKHSKKL